MATFMETRHSWCANDGDDSITEEEEEEEENVDKEEAGISSSLFLLAMINRLDLNK